MRHMTQILGARAARLMGACALLAGGAAASGMIIAAPAGAAPCAGAAESAGTPCTITGTLTIGSGALTLTSPLALGWGGAVSGLDQHLVDTVAGQEGYQVNDATGVGTGWRVSLAATTFSTGAVSLPDTGTFSTNGSLASITSTTAPTAACGGGSTCTLPTNQTVYPVAITTDPSAPTPVNIYDAAAATGLGALNIGGSTAAAPVGWWLNVLGNTAAGAYNSTVTLQIDSGP
jgi:hypothetical protein